MRPKLLCGKFRSEVDSIWICACLKFVSGARTLSKWKSKWLLPITIHSFSVWTDVLSLFRMIPHRSKQNSQSVWILLIAQIHSERYRAILRSPKSFRRAFKRTRFRMIREKISRSHEIICNHFHSEWVRNWYRNKQPKTINPTRTDQSNLNKATRTNKRNQLKQVNQNKTT